MTTIAVFGSGKGTTDDEDYAIALDIGQRLGEAGYTVMTGGYGGAMQGVSQGAREKGAHVIGVTTAQFDAQGRVVNPYVIEERKMPTARERLMYLTQNADAYIVLPGGIGTLAELANVWELMRVGDMQPKPLICFGEFWRRLAFDLLTSQYVEMTQWTSTRFVETPEQVIDILAEGLTPPEEPQLKDTFDESRPPIGDAS